MKRSKYIIPLAFFLLGFITRIGLVEKFQSHWDGPLYSIAVLKYNLLQQTPPPPGYPIYIALGKFFNFFINEPHMALLLVGVLLSGIGVVAIYYFGRALYGETVGVISALILLSSPSFYFFGVTTYGYIGLPTTTALLALGIYSVFVKRKREIIFVPIIFSVSIGYRPQDIFFIAPIFLLYLSQFNFREILKIVLTVFCASLLWIVPVASSTGGIYEYISILVNSGGGVFHSIRLIFDGFAYDVLILRLFRGIYLTLGIGLLLVLLYIFIALKRKKYRFRVTRESLFFTVLMLPAFLFHLFLRIEHAGYQFTYLVPLIVLLSLIIVRFTRNNKILLITMVAIITSFNLSTFFRDRDPNFEKPYFPSSFHYSEVLKNDFKWQKKLSYIVKNYDPKETVIIVGTPELFNPAAYHLKGYFVFQFDALTTEDRRFLDVWRVGYRYELKTERSKNRVFLVPRFAKNILFIDDESRQWNIENKMLIEFGRNTYLSVINSKGGERYIYGYKSFKLQ